MNVVVELQKSATPKVVLNQLYKHTPLQSSFGFNMLALVPVGEPRADGSVAIEPHVLSLKQMLEYLHRASARRHHAPHAVRPAQGRRARAPARRLPDRARQHRRSHRDHPREPNDRRSANETIGALRSLRHAGASDRRHAPARAGRSRTPEDRRRIRRADQDHRRIARHPGQPAPHPRDRQERDARSQEALRRRAPHGDRRRRRRNLDGAADSERRRRRDVHGRRLHQARLGRHVPHAEPRRPRRHRHFEPQARGRRAQLLHDEDARSRALLHEQGARLSFARVRDSRYHAPGARHRARQPVDAAAGRRSERGLPDRQVRRREVPRDGDAQRRHQEDEARRVRQRAPQRAQRDQPRREGRTARGRSLERFARHHSRVAAAAWPCTSTRRRCVRWAATRAASRR